jgi:hypothetical protein
MTLRLDHVAIATTDLQGATGHLERRLGVPFEAGGRHPMMGTYNRLLSLGPDLYLEVIAIDPEADRPERPRWFGLDGFSGKMRPIAWIVATDDLEACPAPAGRPLRLSRADLKWSITVPDDGLQPNDGLFPAFIQWEGDSHPSTRLPDRGCRLAGLTISHPDMAPIRAAIAGLDDGRILLRVGPPALMLEITTPNGTITL